MLCLLVFLWKEPPEKKNERDSKRRKQEGTGWIESHKKRKRLDTASQQAALRCPSGVGPTPLLSLGSEGKAALARYD